MALLKSFKSAVFLGIPWLIATGGFMLIRYYQTGATAVWENWQGSYTSFWLLASVILTLVDHGSEALCQSNRIRRRPYRWIIALKVSAMALAMLVMIVLTYAVGVSQGVIPPGRWWAKLFVIVTDAKFYVSFAYALSAIAVFSFIRLMKDMIGDRLLKNLVLGRYHHPRIEQRVFMFLDMKSSTTHAERLGHELFSRLIQDCFADITESVIGHEAEIYQYVGDEIILTWNAQQGARNGNCLRVLFDYCDALERHGDHYRQRYGFVPRFKAGVSFGAVTVAEVGVLKRDIAYLSDVLNTAARVEGECNKHDQILMISESVRQLVGDPQGLVYQEIGALELRGKDEKVLLYGVQQQFTG